MHRNDKSFYVSRILIIFSLITRQTSGQNDNANANAFNCNGKNQSLIQKCDVTSTTSTSDTSPIKAPFVSTPNIKDTTSKLKDNDLPIVPFDLHDTKDNEYKRYIAWSSVDAVKDFFSEYGKDAGIAIMFVGSGNLGKWQYQDSHGAWSVILPDQLGSLPLEEEQTKVHPDRNIYTFDWQPTFGSDQRTILLIPKDVQLRFTPSDSSTFWSSGQSKEDACMGFALWDTTTGYPDIINAGNLEKLTVTVVPNNCLLCNTLGLSSAAVLLCAERYDCNGVASGTDHLDRCGDCKKITDAEPASCKETTDQSGATLPSISIQSPDRPCSGVECSLKIHHVSPKVADTNSYRTQVGCIIQGAKALMEDGDSLVVNCSLVNQLGDAVAQMESVMKRTSGARLSVTGHVARVSPSEDMYSVKCSIAKDSSTYQVSSTQEIKFIDFSRYSLEAVSSGPIGNSDSTVPVLVTPSLRQGDFSKTARCIIGHFEDGDQTYHSAKLVRMNRIECDLKGVTKSGTVNLTVSFRPEMKPENLIKYQTPVEVMLEERPASIDKIELSESLDTLQVHFDRVVQGPSDCLKLFSKTVRDKFGENPSCTFMGSVLIIQLGTKAQVNKNTAMTMFAGAHSSILSMAQASANDGSLMKEIKVNVNMPSKKVKPAFSLIGPSEVKVCTNATKMYTIEVQELRGTGHLPCTVQWDITDPKKHKAVLQDYFNEAEGSMQLNIPASVLVSNTKYKLTSKICNALGECSTQHHTMRTPRFHTETSALFSVKMLGDTQNMYYQEKMMFMARDEVITCQQKDFPNNMLYVWKVNDEEKGNGSVLEIPAYTFKENDEVSVTLEGSIDTTDAEGKIYKSETMITKMFPIKSRPLQLSVNGQSVKTGANNPLQFKMSSSDTSKQSENDDIKIVWSCLQPTLVEGSADEEYTNETCDFQDHNLLKNYENSTTLIIPPGELMPESTYFFKVMVTDGSDTKETVLTTEVASLIAPEVQVDPLQEQNPDPRRPLDLAASVQATSDVQCHIDIPSVKLPPKLEALTRRSATKAMMLNKGLDISFTIPTGLSKKFPDWRGLAPNMDYRILYKATTMDGSAETEQIFTTNGPPTAGTVKVNPASGIVALISKVHVSIEGVQDLPQDYPLIYKFGLIVTAQQTNTTIWLPPMASVTDYIYYLPTANPTSNDCENRLFRFVVEACDQRGACSQTYSDTIAQTHESNDLESPNEIVPNEINNLIETGNYLTAFILLEALKLENCANADFDVQPHQNNLLNVFLDQIEVDLRSEHGRVDFGKLAMINQMVGSGGIDNEETLGKLTNIVQSTMQNREDRRKRKKRSTEEEEKESSDIIPHEKLAVLLEAAEILYESEGGTGERKFLEDLTFLKSHLCRQSKAGMNAFMLIGEYVTITAETIDPNVQLPYELMEKFAMSPELSDIYKQWACSNNQKICSSVCVSSVTIVNNMERNKVVRSMHTYGNAKGREPTVTPLLDWFDFIDPVTGLSNGVYGKNFEVNLTLNQSQLLMNPKCVLVDVMAQSYKLEACHTVHINRLEGIPTSITCSCTDVGVIGVYSELPDTLASYRAVAISYHLPSITQLPSDYFNGLFDYLSTTVDVPRSRFVGKKFIAGGSLVTFTLRPSPSVAEYSSQEAMSVTVSLIEDAVQRFPGFNESTPEQFKAVSLLRDSTKIDMDKAQNVHFEAKSAEFDTVIGSKVKDIQSKWANDVADSIFVASARIKDLALAKGSIKVSLIIDPPESSSDDHPSAGEAALFLEERLKYNELALTNMNDQLVQFDADTFLVENYDPQQGAANDTLYVVIGIIVASLVGLVFIVMAILLIMVLIKKHQMRISRLHDTANSAFMTRLSSPPSLKGSYQNQAFTGSHHTVSTFGGTK